MVVGAGGLACEVWEALRNSAAPAHELAGLFASPQPSPETWLAGQAKVIGSEEDLFDSTLNFPHTNFVVAIGDIRARLRLSEGIQKAGGLLYRVLDPSARIGSTCSVGNGSIVLSHVSITANVVTGSGVVINPQASLSHDVNVGSYCNIGPGANLCGRVTVGDRGNIGAGATILPDITIGAEATIGAGAVVTRDVAPGDVVTGIPARSHV